MSIFLLILKILFISFFIALIFVFAAKARKRRMKIAATPKENNFVGVLDAIKPFVCVLLPDGTLIESNATACSVVGLAREALIGRKFWDAKWWNYSEDCRANIRAITERVAKGASVHDEIKYQDEKGNIRHLEFSMAPVRSSAGVTKYLVLSGVDIEKRKIFEAEIINARTEAEIAIKPNQFLWPV